MDEDSKLVDSIAETSRQYQVTAAIIVKALDENSLDAHKTIIAGLAKPRQLSAAEFLLTLLSLIAMAAGVYYYNVTLEPIKPCIPVFGTGQPNDPIFPEDSKCRTK